MDKKYYIVVPFDEAPKEKVIELSKKVQRITGYATMVYELPKDAVLIQCKGVKAVC